MCSELNDHLKKRYAYVLIPSLCECKLMPVNPTTSVLRRHRREDTEEKVWQRQRHRQEWWGHKPRSARSHWKLEEGGKILPSSLWREHYPVDTFILDFWSLEL